MQTISFPSSKQIKNVFFWMSEQENWFAFLVCGPLLTSPNFQHGSYKYLKPVLKIYIFKDRII